MYPRSRHPVVTQQRSSTPLFEADARCLAVPRGSSSSLLFSPFFQRQSQKRLSARALTRACLSLRNNRSPPSPSSPLPPLTIAHTSRVSSFSACARAPRDRRPSVASPRVLELNERTSHGYSDTHALSLSLSLSLSLFFYVGTIYARIVANRLLIPAWPANARLLTAPTHRLTAALIRRIAFVQLRRNAPLIDDSTRTDATFQPRPPKSAAHRGYDRSVATTSLHRDDR